MTSAALRPSVLIISEKKDTSKDYGSKIADA